MLYHYVGPRELLLIGSTARFRVRAAADILVWASETNQKPNTAKEVTATFIVDAHKDLWIADRHSEHVNCAAGEPVLSAGEMTFCLAKGNVSVTAATNQSTGFCPEPASWNEVKAALNKAAIIGPDTWTTAFCFRLCPLCESVNLVKDDYFVCALCEAELPLIWNPRF